MRISKEFKFEASHILSRHPGKCSRLHGHSWRVRITVAGEVDFDTGFVLDYAKLSMIVDPVIDSLDHRHLNAFVSYPSAENIAIYIADMLRPNLDSLAKFFIVEVSETQKAWARWDSRVKSDLMELDAGPVDAQWKAPPVSVPVDAAALDREMSDASHRAAISLREFEMANTTYEQLCLYQMGQKRNPLFGNGETEEDA